MPVTFNSNNNYSVDIITEPDVLNPTVIKYSSDTNTPFVEIKITPDIFQYPLIAGNLNFDSLPRFIKHEPSLNVNFSCTPASSPHQVNSSFSYEEIITSGNIYILGTSCSSAGTNMVTTSSQGPFQSERNGATIYGDLSANGVAWTKVVWIEVYEADDGTMINDQISPEAYEDLQLWNTWSQYPLITNNIYPMYIRAFVFLEYGPSGPGGLSNNINIQIDIDENTPVYGCTDPNATNYYAGATVDDGSCTLPPPPPVFTLPPFTLTHVVDYTVIDLNYPNSPFDPYTQITLSIDIQQATNALPNSSGVTYEITELYYIDDTGAQVDVQLTSNSNLLSPPYALTPIPPSGFTYYFADPPGSNIVTYSTPTNVTLSVPPSVLAGPVIIDGVLLPRTGSAPLYAIDTDIYCTIVATDSGVFTSSHTEILNITG